MGDSAGNNCIFGEAGGIVDGSRHPAGERIKNGNADTENKYRRF